MNVVHFREVRINTAVISKEEILEACKAIVSKKGLSALNMRAVAKRCNIALGSVYNYFRSKDDLVIAAVESVWDSIFDSESTYRQGISFTEYIEAVFKKLRKGMIRYPDFFTAHSLSFAGKSKNDARNKMHDYFSFLKKEMLNILQTDTAIKKNVFSEEFGEDDLADFVLTNFIGLLVLQKRSCDILIAGIRKIIYP